jgi:hypothetical protein
MGLIRSPVPTRNEAEACESRHPLGISKRVGSNSRARDLRHRAAAYGPQATGSDLPWFGIMTMACGFY